MLGTNRPLVERGTLGECTVEADAGTYDSNRTSACYGEDSNGILAAYAARRLAGINRCDISNGGLLPQKANCNRQ